MTPMQVVLGVDPPVGTILPLKHVQYQRQEFTIEGSNDIWHVVQTQLRITGSTTRVCILSRQGKMRWPDWDSRVTLWRK